MGPLWTRFSLNPCGLRFHRCFQKRVLEVCTNENYFFCYSCLVLKPIPKEAYEWFRLTPTTQFVNCHICHLRASRPLPIYHVLAILVQVGYLRVLGCMWDTFLTLPSKPTVIGRPTGNAMLLSLNGSVHV